VKKNMQREREFVLSNKVPTDVAKYILAIENRRRIEAAQVVQATERGRRTRNKVRKLYSDAYLQHAKNIWRKYHLGLLYEQRYTGRWMPPDEVWKKINETWIGVIDVD